CAAITEPRPDTDALEQAINEPGNDRWPFDLARIQLAYGSHLRRIKRTTDARRRLAEAAEIFHRLAPTPPAPRPDPEPRAPPRPPRPRGRTRLAPRPPRAPPAPLAGGGGPSQQGAPPPPLPLPANGLHSPLPGLSQARHHFSRRTPRRPHRHVRLRMTSCA